MIAREELQALASSAVFARDYDFRVTAFAEGECTVDVPFQIRARAAGRRGWWPRVHGRCGRRDVVGDLTRLGAGDGSVTATLTTAFLGAARKESFRCTARVLKLGRRLIHGVAECVTTDGRLLTHHTVTYMRPASAAGPTD